MSYVDLQKQELAYRYEFSMNELDRMHACVDAHGFAIVKDVLPEDMVEELQESVRQVVDANGNLEPGQSRTHTSFIEHAPASWKLLDYAPFMRIHRVLLGTDDLTVHRSAAIIRNPGSRPLGWHSDWCGFTATPPKTANDVLNRGPGPSGTWFYLTGSYPQHGGLAVIADSHPLDWQGPKGFCLTEDRGSFYPERSEPAPYVGFDVPGLVPLFTDPGDMIIFAARTYHAAFPNSDDKPRLSCGINFRPRRERIDAPWPLPASAASFIAAVPKHLNSYVEQYTGIDMTWKPV